MPVDDALADIGAALAGPQQGAGAVPGASSGPPPTGIDAALADLAKSPEQLHAEIAAARPQSSGPVANLAAGGNEMLANIAGAPVDAMTWGLNKAHGLVTGDDQPWITNPVGGSRSIEHAMGLVGADPNNVIAGNAADRVARGTGAGAVGMVAPYMAGRAMIAGGIDSGYPGAIARMLGGSAPADAGAASTAAGAAGNAAIGGGAALAGQGAEALLPEDSAYRPLANFGGQLVGGGAIAGAMGLGKAGINAGAHLARDAVGPLHRPTLEKIVGNKLYAASDDPVALANNLDTPRPDLVPGSTPTTFQATGDEGIGRLQSSLPSAAFDARAAEQNAARVGALQGVAPDAANPGAVRDFLQQHLDRITAEGDANVAAARQNAQQAFDQTGGRLPPEEYGALMRDQLEAAKAATKRQESALWQAIDPEGKLTIDATPLREAANKIAAEVPETARPPEGEERAIFGFAQQAGSAVPFTDFAALRGRLLQSIRDERQNGQTPALRRMQMLRQSMDDTIAGAAENVAQQQAQAVSTGVMRPEDTMFSRFANVARDWYANRNAVEQAATGGATGAPFGGNARVRPSPVPGALRAENAPSGGLGSDAGNPGVQGQIQPVANFDADAASRYRAAADATRERAQTFNNPTVGPALQERGGAYRIADSRLPERFIASPEGVQAYRDAGGDPATMRDALIADLRGSATNPDGSLNAAKFATWQLKRSAALRAFPELQHTLGDAVAAQNAVDAATSAARQQTLAYQRGAARYFLNAEPEQAVQSALNGRNPIGDLGEISRMVSGDPEAKAGLQRAIADYLISRTVRPLVGDAEVGTLNNAAFQRIMGRDSALQQVFSPDQMTALRNIAADMQRASAPLPSGPSALAAVGSSGKLSVISQYLGHGLAGLAGYLLGGVHGAIEGTGAYTMGKTALDAMKRAGIERTDQLLTEALLNPELAKTLLMKATPENRPLIAQRLGSQLGTLAGVSGAQAGAGAEQPQSTAAHAQVLPGVDQLARVAVQGVPAAQRATTVAPRPQGLTQLLAIGDPRMPPSPLAAMLAHASSYAAPLP